MEVLLGSEDTPHSTMGRSSSSRREERVETIVGVCLGANEKEWVMLKEEGAESKHGGQWDI
jgi:hypothetical protein